MHLGIDVGTGSTKAVLVDDDGRVVGRGAAAHQVRAPGPDAAESDPADWWASVRAAAAEAGAGAVVVEAIGLSGQMHGAVVCDDSFVPLRPAVLWADRRSRDHLAPVADAARGCGVELANPVVTGMVATTLAWLLDAEPALRERCRWVLQPKDWLGAQLTGAAWTEPSDASATLLWDATADAWSEPLARTLGFDPAWLAVPIGSSAPRGVLTDAAAAALGLTAGTPIVAGGGDTACALLAAGALDAGEAMLTIGTGAQVVIGAAPAVDATHRTHRFRTTGATGWYAMAAIQNAGLALERAWSWLGVTWDEALALARHAPPGAAGVRFVPHVAGERTPFLDPDRTASWSGLALDHGREHLARAAFEGVACGIALGVDALRDAGHHVGALRFAGGGSTDPWWRQLLADVLDVPLHLVDVPDASAVGAALLAGAPQATPSRPSMPSATVEPGPDRGVLGEVLDEARRAVPPR